MKKILLLLSISASAFALSQNVIFNKVIKVHDNKDKFLYRIDSLQQNAEYLAEIEVQGFSADDAEVFGKLYKKAKEIGANAFSYLPFKTVDGNSTFDPWHYKLKLYYVPKDSFPREDNTLYIFSAASGKEQTVTFNKENIRFTPRTFTKRKLVSGTVYKLSTKKLLGASVQLTAQDHQPVQHFQLMSFHVNSDQTGKGGINFKSGDIILLEKSYAEFLSVIYKQF